MPLDPQTMMLVIKHLVYAEISFEEYDGPRAYGNAAAHLQSAEEACGCADRVLTRQIAVERTKLEAGMGSDSDYEPGFKHLLKVAQARPLRVQPADGPALIGPNGVMPERKEHPKRSSPCGNAKNLSEREANERTKRAVEARIQRRREVDRVVQPDAKRYLKRVSIDIEEAPAKGRTLVILTTIGEFTPSYSLCNVIIDQAIAGYMAGYKVHVAGMMSLRREVPELDGVAVVDPVIPEVGWGEDVSNPSKVSRLASALQGYLSTIPRNAVIITHDLILQSWYLSFAEAIHQFAKDNPQDFIWYHQVHSDVGARPPQAIAQHRATLPQGHRLAMVSYSAEGADRYSAYYQCPSDDIFTVPNIRDFRTWGGVTEHTSLLMHWARPQIATFCQVYPLSTPRAEAKGIFRVIEVFGELKRRGYPVCLIIANAHANGSESEAMLRRIRASVVNEGLDLDLEVVITSDVIEGTEVHGLSALTIRELQMISNVFLFPSISEACGLVALEALQVGTWIGCNQGLYNTRNYMEASEDFGGDIGVSLFNWGTQQHPSVKPVSPEMVANVLTGYRDGLLIKVRTIQRDLTLEHLANVLGGLARSNERHSYDISDIPKMVGRA